MSSGGRSGFSTSDTTHVHASFASRPCVTLYTQGHFFIPMPFNLFRTLTKAFTSSYLGIDIGTTSVKVVEVARGEKRPRLVNYGLLESKESLIRANTAIQTSSLKLFEQEAAELLKLLLVRMRPKTTAAVASIPVFSSFTTVISFPQMSQEDLEKAILFQARQYVPLPLSEVALDWLKVGEYEDEHGFHYTQVLLISVPQEQIRKYQEIAKKAGLTLVSLEVEPLSLARMLIAGDPTPTFIIDIGSRSTSILVAEGGTLRFVGQTDFASASLTQAVASSLNVNPLRAEELKRERGIMGTGPNYELSTIMLPFLDAIIEEVRKTEFGYRSQFPSAVKVERAILTGGGAHLLGIQNYMARQMGIPVVFASPLVRFEYPPAIEPLVRELNPMLGVALGLAARQFP